MYVIDRSLSLRVLANEIREMLHNFVSYLDYEQALAGIVGFNNESVLIQSLTNDEAALHQAIDFGFADEMFDHDTHISAGHFEAHAGFESSTLIDDHGKVVVLLTDGYQNIFYGGAIAAVQSASFLKNDNIRIYAIGIGDPLMSVIEAMASLPTDVYAFNAPTLNQATLHIFDNLCAAPPLPPPPLPTLIPRAPAWANVLIAYLSSILSIVAIINLTLLLRLTRGGAARLAR